MRVQLERDAEALGRHIRTWRKMLRLTAAQLADRADVSRETLRRLETGKPVSSHTLMAVCRGLGVTERLLDGVDPWQTDIGRLTAESDLPKRVRHG